MKAAPLVLLLFVASTLAMQCEYDSLGDCLEACSCCWDFDDMECKPVWNVDSSDLTEAGTVTSYGSSPTTKKCATRYNEKSCSKAHPGSTKVEVKTNAVVLTLFIIETLAIICAMGFLVWKYLLRRWCTGYTEV